MVDVSQIQLAKAARQRIEAASLFVQSQGKGFVPMPSVGAYLAHVGLECLLKAWLLLRSNATDTHQLRRRLPPHEVDELFTARGHTLSMLAERVSLRRHLVADNQPTLLDGPVWHRLANPPRPFSLRYGVLILSPGEALEEVNLASALLASIEKVIK